MKIGVGVTAYNRPKHLELWRNEFHKSTPHIYDFAIQDDTKERLGISKRKNNCLISLRKCDYIFLFDDDTFPIKEGWAEWFIELHKQTGQHHFLYMRETSTIKKIDENNGINIFNNCSGCFMFLTKEVLEKVGAFGDYGFYGYEHAGYTDRIHQAGLTPMGKYLCPKCIGEYIYAMDFDYSRKNEFQDKVTHKPSMPVKEIISLQSQNIIKYMEDIKTIYKPL